MSPLHKVVRFWLTRLFFRALGIRVDYWRCEVVKLWSMPPEQLDRRLDQHLTEKPLRGADGISISQLANLNQAPRLSKQALREITSSMVQQGGAKKQALSRFTRHTAGTTGEPTHITLNRTDLGRMLGVRDYCFRHYGIRLGEAEARIWGRPDSGFKARLRDFLLNRRVYYPMGKGAEAEVQSLVQSRPDYIYGYSSLILETARVIEKNGWKAPPLSCVICTAETILPSQKNYIERVFHAPVAEEYGATEFEIIAFECRNGHRHLVNPWLVVETKENQCLVTDVSRSSPSLVRYELGDALTIGEVNCAQLGSVQFVDELEGRSINLFAYISASEKFHSVKFAHIIDSYQKEFSESFSFTIIQKDYGIFTLYASPLPKWGTEHLLEYTKAKLESEIGRALSIKASEDLAAREVGKRSYFLQRMEHKQ